MNREERRKFAKLAKKNGMSDEAIQTYLQARELGIDKVIEPVEISEGDKISINVDQIKNRKAYDNMSQKYRDFVEGHDGEVFTAYVDSHGLIGLKEYPEWLFYSGDLKLVNDSEV